MDSREEGRKYDSRSGPGLSRRTFLIVGGAGVAGLAIAGCVGSGLRLENAAPRSNRGLNVVVGGYPRAFFFRHAEGAAARGTPYEEWETRFLPLNGIMGKVLDEELPPPRQQRNVEYFTRYKERHPQKAVFLHYNGTGRRPQHDTEEFFAGHWLYYAGTHLAQAVGSSSPVLHVEDTSVFQTGRGEGTMKSVNDDIGIAPVGADGQPDWAHAEQVRLQSTDRAGGTITVERGAYGTAPMELPEDAYLAAHVMKAPPTRYRERPEDNVIWVYNLSVEGPRDARGRNGVDALVNDLVSKFEPGGALSAFDGLQFDVLRQRVFGGGDVDVNTDGQRDGGFIDGVNTYLQGTIAFSKSLSERLPEKIIMADGHKPAVNQRSFGLLNGIESEGWPEIFDYEIRGWSSGLNRHAFWTKHSMLPPLSYANFRYLDPETYGGPRKRKARNEFRGEIRERDDSYKKLRLVLAAMQFTDSAFTYGGGYQPPPVEWKEQQAMVSVFDELWKGREQKTNWLGMPSGPAGHLAARSPDLLSGQGETWPERFVERFEGTAASFRLGKKTPGLTVEAANAERGKGALNQRMAFTLPAVEVPGGDLFLKVRLKAEPLRNYSSHIGRRVYVEAAPRGAEAVTAFTWANDEPFEATFYYRDLGPGVVDLTFRVEGMVPITIQRLTAHSAADAMYRAFEQGAVFANPSDRPYTFEVARLFPEVRFRRLRGTKRQDPATNNGEPVGETLTLAPNDALFVMKAAK